MITDTTPAHITQEQLEFWANGVITLMTPLVVWIVKLVAPSARVKIPSRVLPLMTPLIGMAFGQVLKGFGVDVSMVDSAIAGGLGVTLREIIDQNLIQPTEKGTAAVEYKPRLELQPMRVATVSVPGTSKPPPPLDLSIHS